MNSSQKQEIVEAVLSHSEFIFPRSTIISLQGEVIESPEPLKEEKITKLLSLLEKDVALFLEKYGKFLQIQQLDLIETFYCENYEVNWYLRNLKEQLQDISISSLTRKNRTKNRRFAYLQQLEEQGEYFSEESMKLRDPALYFHYVAKYNKNASLAAFPPETSLVDRLLHNADLCSAQQVIDEERKKILNMKKETEEPIMNAELFGKKPTVENIKTIIKQRLHLDFIPKELDSLLSKLSWNPQFAIEVAQYLDKYELNHAQSEQEEEEEEEQQDHDFIENPIEEISEIQKEAEYEEFKTIMKQRFLDGLDKDMDYNFIDNNESLDDLKQINQDAQDKYFDEDEAIVD